MNCQDVSLAMDDRDIGALDEAQRREFDAHLETCPDCARDWDLHVRLAATRTPPLPAGLLQRIERSLPVGVAGRRTSRRLVVVGALVAFAAAAVMLAVHLGQTPTLADAPATTLVAPIPEPELIGVSATAVVAPPPQASTREETSPPAEPKPQVAARAIRVLALQNQATGLAFEAVETFFAAFLSNLRGNNDLVVLAPDQPESAEAAIAKVRVRFRGYGPPPEGKFTLEFGYENLQPDGSYKYESITYLTVDIAPACAGTAPFDTTESCKSPLHVAGALARSVRGRLLRPDPLQQRDPQSRLLDQSLSQNDRFKALNELSGKREDPAVVRGAIDLASTATDPVLRAFIWSMLRNVRSPELVEPLIEAMVRDPDANVRLQALINSSADFGGDPRVREAFATIARTDAKPMVRALAQRGLAGEEYWTKYMADTLKDTRLPEAERIEALVFELGRPVRMDLQQFLKDHDALPALREILPGLGRDTSGRNPAFSLLQRLAPVEDPAITDLVLDVVSGNPGKFQPASSLVYMLGNMLKSRPDNPRIRAVLEKVSTEEPDPNLRQTIAELLKTP